MPADLKCVSEVPLGCAVCSAVPVEDFIEKYLEVETIFIEQTKTLLKFPSFHETEFLYSQALRLFADHWVLHALEHELILFAKRITEENYVYLLTKQAIYLEKLCHPTFPLVHTYRKLAEAVQDPQWYSKAIHAVRACEGHDSEDAKKYLEAQSKL